MDIWSLGCVAYEVVFGSSLFCARAGAHAPGSEVDEELEAQITSDEPVQLPEVTRARRQPSQGAVECVAAMLGRSGEARPNADSLLMHPWICGEPDPAIISTSPIPMSSSPLAALTSALGRGRNAVSTSNLTSMHESCSSSLPRGNGGGGFRGSFLGRDVAGETTQFGGRSLLSASDGDFGSGVASVRRRNRAAELLAWPPKPSPTSTLLFPNDPEDGSADSGRAAEAEAMLRPGAAAPQPVVQMQMPRRTSAPISVQTPPISPRAGEQVAVGSSDHRSSSGGRTGSSLGGVADWETHPSTGWSVVQRPAGRLGGGGGGMLKGLLQRGVGGSSPLGRNRNQSMPAQVGGAGEYDDGSWHGGVLTAAGIQLPSAAPGSASKRRNSVAPLLGDGGDGKGGNAADGGLSLIHI